MKKVTVLIGMLVVGAVYLFAKEGQEDVEKDQQASEVVQKAEIAKAETEKAEMETESELKAEPPVSIQALPSSPQTQVKKEHIERQLQVLQVSQEALEAQQQEIAAMMQEYEQVRSDPVQREAHRLAMQQKLKQYSKDVLPVALSKIQEQQSNDE